MMPRKNTKNILPRLILGAAVLGLLTAYGCSPATEAAHTGDIVVLPAGKAVDLQAQAAADKVTIFDFHADWCAPCRIIGPKLEEFVSEHPEEFALRSVDVIDWESEAAVSQGIEYLPYLAIVDKDGTLLATGDDSFAHLRENHGLDLMAALLIL